MRWKESLCLAKVRRLYHGRIFPPAQRPGRKTGLQHERAAGGRVASFDESAARGSRCLSTLQRELTEALGKRQRICFRMSCKEAGELKTGGWFLKGPIHPTYRSIRANPVKTGDAKPTVLTSHRDYECQAAEDEMRTRSQTTFQQRLDCVRRALGAFVGEIHPWQPAPTQDALT